MTKFLLPLCLLLILRVAGQNCPAGYEERNVMCDGKIIKKCLPINQKNKDSWWIKWADCKGSLKAGSGYADFYDSYERCLQEAEKAKTQTWFSCPKMQRDVNNYIIYLKNINACNSNIDSDVEAIKDLKEAIKLYLSKYKLKLKNYRLFIEEEKYKPGSVIKEYESVLKRAEENANNLSLKLNTITDENISQFEKEFENMQKEEKQVIQADLNYKSRINNSNTSNNNTTSTSSNTATTNQQKNLQFQNQLNAINQEYQARHQDNEQFYNTLQTGLQTIADILEQNAKRKAEERRRQYNEEQERKQQKLQAQLEEERKIQEEEDRVNNEMIRQYSIDSVILSSNNLTMKTSSINPRTDSVYYIGYKREYDEQQATSLSLKIFVVYRYSDGTFPLFSNIIEKSKLENNIDRYGITLLIGFFESRPKVLKALDDIQTNAKDLGINSVVDKSIRKINFLSTSKITDTNFWNQ